MKRGYQYLMLTGLGGLLCLFLSVSANAQRGGGHSDGGGGRSGGGQSFSRGGGGGGFSGGGRSSGGFSGGGQSFSRGSSGGGQSYGGGQVSGGFSRGQSSNSYNGGSRSYGGDQVNGGFSRGRTTNGFSSPQTQSFQRGNAYSRGESYGSNPIFRRANPGNYGGGYRGSNGGAYRGGVSIHGGFSRGGHYYAGGYGRSYSYGGGSVRYSPWSNRGGYYYNRGFYSSSYYPRLGFSLGVLPYGYYPFAWGNDRFYYSGGYFYQYDNNQYTVVEPPIGAAVNSLPGNAQAITINGQQFYELNGVYYTPITRDDGSIVYQVAGKDGKLDTYSSPENGYAPQNDGYAGRQNNSGGAVNAQPMDDVDQDLAMPEIGDLFYSLPSNSRKIKIQGQNYFVSPDDYYYQETRDQKGDKAYKVMGTPDNAPGN